MILIERIKSSQMYEQIVRKSRSIRYFLRKFLNDWSLIFASMLAYDLLISLLPIIVTCFGIFGFVLKNSADIQQSVKNLLLHGFSTNNQTSDGIQQIIDLAVNQLSEDAGWLLITGIILAMFGSSRLFISIDNCLTIIYRLPERTFLRENLLAFSMLFLFLLFIPLIVLLNAIPSILVRFLPQVDQLVGTFFLGIFLSLLAQFLLFESIYFFIPNKKMSFQQTWCGALIAALTLQIFLSLFPLYLNRFMTNYVGQIGFAVILLLFFYYFAVILLFGAQINAFFFEYYQPFSDGLGTYLSQIYDESRISSSLCHDETGF